MNKRQWARITAQYLHENQQGIDVRALSYAEVEAMLDAAIETLKSTLQSGEPVTVKGFGTFEVITLPPRVVAANLSPGGGSVQIPARRRLRFQPSRGLDLSSDSKPPG